SGNRNFEGRISPDVTMNYLASPPLVVIYSIAGTMDIDLNNDVLATTPDGREVRLVDLWPSTEEIEEIVGSSISAEMYS
ncbi:aconitase family protein, partial [Streptomyces sp. URMC 126]